MKTLLTTRAFFILSLGLLTIFSGCNGVIIRPAPAELSLSEKQVGGERGFTVNKKVLIVDIDGAISNIRSTGLLGSDNPVSLFCEKLDKAQGDSSVAALILRINSPGGSVGAVDIMYRRLKRFRQVRPQIPVIAAIEDVGASGGYYMACGCDEIMALPSSITGSIGVIMQTFSVTGTMNILGVRTRSITSGPFKDIASPFKPLDDKDAEILQNIVDQLYGDFVKIVDNGRHNLDTAKVKELADGRVYTGRQALEVGLVDSLGDMSDAEKLAKKMAGISRAKLIMYHRPTGWRGSAESSADNAHPHMQGTLGITPEIIADMARPHFMYIWQ